MKNPVTLLGALFLAAGLNAQAPLYLNIGSHNEVQDSVTNGLNYISDVNDYLAIKSIALQIADTVTAHNARWNCQVEQNFVRACLKHDTAYTNPNDLLEYLNSLPDVEVDVHNHFDNTPPIDQNFNPYNAPDVAHLLDSCGLPYPRTNQGGFIYKDFTSPAVNEDWSAYNSGPQAGSTFPDYTWRPVVIWGAGSPGHTSDYKSYGIWKPDAPTQSQFPVHNQNNYMTCIGQGCDDGFLLADTSSVAYMVAQMQSLLYYISQQPVTPNTFWTATIMLNHKHYQSANYVTRLGQLLTALDPYAQNGQIVWATLTEKYNTWHNLHSNPADYFDYACTGIPLAEQELPVAGDGLQVYPNPASGTAEVQWASTVDATCRLIDMTGRTVREVSVSSDHLSLDVADVSNGVYWLQLEKEGKVSGSRVVVQH